MAVLKPTTPLLAPNKEALKPASPLRPKTAPKTPISHPQRRRRFQSRLSRRPQRRCRFQSHTSTSAQRRWRFQSRLVRRLQRRRRFQSRLGRRPQRRRWFQPHTDASKQRRHRFQESGPPGLQDPDAIPVAGGGAWPDDQWAADVTNVSTPGPTGVEGAGGTGGPDCSARGRRRGLAGQRADAPSHTSVHQAPPVWRAPEGPEGTGGLRDRPLRAFRLACGDLAGGRARRRPEHQRCRKQHHQ